MKVTLTIGQLSSYIEEYKQHTLQHNQEISVKDLEIKVPSPSGLQPVNHFIKKEDLAMMQITTQSGHVLKCADNHILISDGEDIYAKDVKPGQWLDHRDGTIQVSEVATIPNRDCYDISIPAPHHYYDSYGLLHHNTIITSTLSKIVEAYGRSIVIVPNKSLVTQTEQDYRNLGLDVGVMYGDRKEYDRTHTICTWQSLNILDKKSKDHLDDDQMEKFMKNLVCVICDECHGVRDLGVIQKLMTQNFRNVPIRWGLTGTLPEEEWNKLSLFTAIGPQIGELSAHELQEAGVLASCQVNILHTQEAVQYGDYQSELKYLTTDDARLNWLTGVIDEISKSGNTMVLVDRIATGEHLRDNLSGSIFVSGEMKNKDRAEYYREMEIVDNRVVIATFGVAAVGINIGKINHVVLVEPGKSFIRVVQSIGRGLRKTNEKNDVVIWDIASKCKFSNNHMNKRKEIYKKVKYPYEIKKVKY